MFSTYLKNMHSVDLSTGIVCVIWCTLLFSPTYVLTQNEACNTPVPPPTNLKVSVSKTGRFNLTWDCNIAEEQNQLVEYIIDVPGTDWETAQVPSKSLIECATFHKGLLFRVRTIINDNCYGNVSELHYAPEGVDGTAVINVSCVAYNMSSMNCSWAVGMKAPDDCRYNLSLMQDGKMETCHSYKKDSLGREIACHLRDLKLKMMKETYLLIEGQSNKSKIQFFDQWFHPSKNVVINPPSNIKVDQEGQNLRVQWERPRGSDTEVDGCFRYELSIQDQLHNQEYKERNITIPIQNFKVGEVYSLRLRAIVNNCVLKDKWSEWSEPVQFAIPRTPYDYKLVINFGVITVAVLALLLLGCLFKRYKVKQKIWPPIPQPKNKLNDFQKQFINDVEVRCPESYVQPQASENEDITTTDFENVALN